VRYRSIIFLSLIGTHLILAALAAFAKVERLAPLLTYTIYYPLDFIKEVGLPVYKTTPLGGFATPSSFGWLMVVATWFLVWVLITWLLGLAISAWRRSRW